MKFVCRGWEWKAKDYLASPRSEWARSVLGGNESDRNLERRWTKEHTQLVTRLTLGVCWVRLAAAVELLEVKKNYLKHKGSKRGERSRIEELIIGQTAFKEVSENKFILLTRAVKSDKMTRLNAEERSYYLGKSAGRNRENATQPASHPAAHQRVCKNGDTY